MEAADREERPKLTRVLEELEANREPLARLLIEAKAERNYFMKKLRDIEKLGEASQWQDKSGVFPRIWGYFQSINTSHS